MSTKPPIHRLKKAEIVFLASHYCPHGHTFLEHYNCWEEAPKRVGFFDIETSNLDADFGIILSYCIKEQGTDKIYERVLTLADIKKAKAGDEDKAVVTQLVADLKKFDKIVTFYGTKFDIPYSRTRALATGIEFPVYGAINHQDMYYIVRNRFKLSSNRLENACRVLLGKTDKTRIENRFWRGAARGDAKCLEYVLDHNRKDVTDLEKLYDKVIDFSKPREVSA